jgi:hypothetical protein
VFAGARLIKSDNFKSGLDQSSKLRAERPQKGAKIAQFLDRINLPEAGKQDFTDSFFPVSRRNRKTLIPPKGGKKARALMPVRL